MVHVELQLLLSHPLVPFSCHGVVEMILPVTNDALSHETLTGLFVRDGIIVDGRVLLHLIKTKMVSQAGDILLAHDFANQLGYSSDDLRDLM